MMLFVDPVLPFLNAVWLIFQNTPDAFLSLFSIIVAFVGLRIMLVCLWRS